MAEKSRLGIGSEDRELKIGQSFTNSKSTAFHSIKYDFKPASVDKNKIATVDVGSNHQVTVTVPHLDGAGLPQTVFKGSQRPYQKECVLIIDKVTGEITLEKLACNIQVKKTRNEFTKMPLLPDKLSQGGGERPTGSTTSLVSRSQTPPNVVGGQRISHRTKVTSGSRRPDRPITNLVPKHSPLHASPSYPSPNHHNKSPKQETRITNHDTHAHSANASLPMIGMDDFAEPLPVHTPTIINNNSSSTNNSLTLLHNNNTTEKSSTSSAFLHISDTEIGEISDTSSSSSGDSDSEHNATAIEKSLTASSGSVSKKNGHSNGLPPSSGAAKFASSNLLNEDLCLSESGSDSD